MSDAQYTMTPLPDTKKTGPKAPVEGKSTSFAMALFMILAAMGLVILMDFQELSMIYLGLLSFLAIVGVFFILGMVSGRIHLGAKRAHPNLVESYADHLSDGIFITNDKGEVVYANEAYFHILRQKRSRFIPTIETALVGEPTIQEAIFRLSKAAKEFRDWEEEIRIQADEEGETTSVLSPKHRWLRISVRPIHQSDKAGHQEGKNIIWRVADITLERSQQEQEYQKLYSAIDQFDKGPAGYFTLRSDGKVQYINHTLRQWLGLEQGYGTIERAEELMEASGADLLLQTFSANPGETITHYVNLTHRDGHMVPAILMGAYAQTEGADNNGNPSSFMGTGRHGEDETLEEARYLGVMVFGQDQEERNGNTAALNEQSLQKFFQAAPIGIATICGEAKISNANTAFAHLIGEGLYQTSGQSLYGHLSEEGQTELKSVLEKLSEGRAGVQPFDVEFTGEEARSARLFFAPLEGGEDAGEVAIIYAIDTTTQRALELQFAQSQKMQAVGQLAGGIAHDFNNVLTAIIGYSDLLISNHRPTDPAFQDIMNIKQNANRAASLVRQLLAFSRRQTLRPEVLSLNDVIADVSMLLTRLLGEKTELIMHHGRDLWDVRADTHQFEQVIINLAVNARDAMEGGGTLTITTENITEHQSLSENREGLLPGEYVLCTVSDTGAGMPSSVLNKIFEPFFTTKDVGKGTGLGLSMVYGIIKQTDGFIYVDSKQGEGTSFKIYLPRYIRQASEEIDPGSPDPEKPKDLTGSETVLLVEDEEAVRSFAARALSTRGYEVLEAGSGVEAIELVKDYPGEIDLVVSDVMMPEMDGPTMLKELTKYKSGVKVIFISGYAEDAFEKNLDKDQKFVFLPKPFSLKQLAATVKETLLM